MVVEETGKSALDEVDGPTIVEAFCRSRIASLPRGSRGLNAAKDLLTAIPAACRLGWADVTVSAAQLFRMLMHAELITSYPIASDMPAALRLIASVCGLVTQRSARRWTVWFSQACDPHQPLGASVREVVTPAMLHRPAITPGEAKPPKSSIRAERDQLAAELASLRAEFHALKTSHDRELSNRQQLEREHQVLVQKTNILEKTLTATRNKAEREIEEARRDASALRVANKNLENEHSELQAKLKNLRETSSALERRLRKTISELFNDRRGLEKTIQRIENIFELDAIDASTPEEYVDGIEQAISNLKKQAFDVMTACGRILNHNTIQLLKARLALIVSRQPGLSEAAAQKFLADPTPNIIAKCLTILRDTHSEIAEECGIHPPPMESLEDFHEAWAKRSYHTLHLK